MLTCLHIDNIHARIAALQTLVETSQSPTHQLHMKPFLTHLIGTLKEEKDAEYIKFALGALVSLLRLPQVSELISNKVELFNLIEQLRENHLASPLIVSSCVELFGLLIAFSNDVRQQHTTTYLSWMSLYASPETAFEIRQACVSSLSSSTLLMSKTLTISACLTASVFMQDDDVDIRDAMTLQIASTLKRLGIKELQSRPFETYQTDYLLQLLLREITNTAIQSQESALSYFNHVSSQLSASKNDDGSFLFESYTPQLFEKEEMNLFEEPLFQYQLAGQAYATLLNVLPLELIQETLNETARDLVLLLQKLKEKEAALHEKYPTLQSTLMNHAKVFYSIYPYLLWYQHVKNSPHASLLSSYSIPLDDDQFSFV
eukprot:CAMPEP_0117419500 /NCGR_PEP_ID=MMETSP0758-20121206/1042_1 /TAXON_ID=63605 /ORGANISM="Percolomonas cosmopolitus, Strain AE-1 (ATCC 50343)" /LENGTH=373 /DNA_ID=CAMNT_0005200587 /DNA_START=594 /DNA_END=1711 /DNA_ORIENTATION=+